MMRMTVAAGATFLAAATLVSCSSALSVGPFAGPRQPGVECIPLQGAKVITDGFDAVRNHGSAVAVIDKFALVDLKGLQLIHAYAVPTQGQWFGLQRGYPPGHFALFRWHWNRRQNLTGASVPPEPGKYEYMNLVLVVALKAARGSYAGIDVWYHVGSNDYHLRTVAGLMVTKRSTNC
jgi:hypothetical protein